MKLKWMISLTLMPVLALAQTPFFDTVVVHSGAQLVAKAGSSKAFDTPPNSQLRLKDKTLHVQGRGAITMQIPYPIKKIVLESGANAYFDQIKTQNLELINEGEGRLVVHAKNASVSSIKNKQNGIIDVYSIKANKLIVTGLNGTLHLSGKVKHLKAKLTGNALLNGKHLHARHVWLRTQEDSAALIHPLQTLNVYAINDSQVAYNHRLPDHEKLIETHNLANVFYVEHPVMPLFKTKSTKNTKAKKKGGKFA